jgi:hypothetical protein
MLLQLLLAFAAAQPVAIPPQPLLKEEIAARDSAFFELFFQGCDPGKLRAMIADDVEMYHDKGGFVFRGADSMIAEYSKSCEARKKPDSWRSRRELVAASLVVDPVPGHGAMQFGEHLFYERKGDGPEKLVGRARFAQVWVLDNGNWKLSRILSYAHGPASQ